VTGILSGGDPSSCVRGGPASKAVPAAQGPQFLPVTHTTISVLTQVGQPITLRNPFPNDPPVPTTTPAANAGPTDQPQSVVVPDTAAQTTNTYTTGDSPMQGTYVLQGTTIMVGSSVVVVQGVTLTQTFTKTQVLVTNAAGSTALVISGTTISIAMDVTTTSSPTNTALHGPGAAIASAGTGSQGIACVTDSFVIFTILATVFFSAVLATT